ncbi:MAG TPA: hypothetical protein PKI93_07770 [Alphaproteobacteria bacterium]|nr:hypothetical protein [Alphaproteobacteria bacterium]HNS44827.1 hypothetical protein [Alphaproteobacteria bacterium]
MGQADKRYGVTPDVFASLMLSANTLGGTSASGKAKAAFGAQQVVDMAAPSNEVSPK